MSQQKTKSSESNWGDKLKWLLVLVLFIAGCVVNNMYQDVAGALRAAGWVLGVCVLLGLAFSTQKGQGFSRFMREAYYEAQRVTWPARDEVVRMTGIVMFVVLVVSVLLWIMDSALLGLTSQLAGSV